MLVNVGCSGACRSAAALHQLRCSLSMAARVLLQVLQPFVDMDLSSVYFSDFHKLDINGIPCYLTRTGCVLCGSSSSVFS